MEKFEPLKPENGSDMIVIMELIRHIEDPCMDEDGNNLLEFYLREAKRILPNITNPSGKEMLIEAIRKYETNSPSGR